jgi:hypothetical protein
VQATQTIDPLGLKYRWHVSSRIISGCHPEFCVKKSLPQEEGSRE